MVVRSRSAVFLVVAGLLVGATGACARQAKPDQSIPLDLSGEHPTAMLGLANHAPVKVIFDSGAGATLISSGIATELGLPNKGDVQVGSPGSTQPVNAMFTSLSGARLGGAEFEDNTAIAIALPQRLSKYGGVVSPKAFAGRLVRFEFKNSRAVVMDKSAANLPPGEGSPYDGESGNLLPAMKIDVAGTEIVAHLDSGSRFGLNLPFELSKTLPLKGPLVPVDPVHMVGGEHKAYTATIRGKVRIGPIMLTDPEVRFLEGVPPIANVGIVILRNLTLVLDPQEQRDWLLLE